MASTALLHTFHATTCISGERLRYLQRNADALPHSTYGGRRGAAITAISWKNRHACHLYHCAHIKHHLRTIYHPSLPTTNLLMVLVTKCATIVC